MQRKTRLLSSPSFTVGKAGGFFDDATQNGVGGCGAILRINEDLYFNLRLGCGKASNTKSELLAFWCLLYFAMVNGIPSLQVFGDSLTIVNWSKGSCKLLVLSLEHWCAIVKGLMSLFVDLQVDRVHREFNSELDALSKSALSQFMSWRYFSL